MKIVVKNESQLAEIAPDILKAIGSRRHVALVGPMGAGKTTLTAALCAAIGVADPVSSPTFSIINEYCNAEGNPLAYHFDFYRIDSPLEAADLGLDDYFDSEAFCFMEWSENVEQFLPDDTVELHISLLPDGSREFSIS